MNKKERRKRIFEEIRADQERYDETTRLLLERIRYYDSKAEEARRRESS